MLAYFILLFFVVVFASFSEKFRITPQVSNFFGFIILTLLISFAGLRDANVGTDANNYVESFKSDRNNDYSVLEIKSSLEIGFLYIERFTKTITHQYWFLLIVIASISVFFYYKVIIKLSLNYSISFFVFITLATYLFIFNGARQGIAAAIFSFAIIQIIKGSFKKYLLWVGIAFLFHKTVLLTIPLYFLFRLKFSIKNLLITIVSSIVLIVFSFQILSFLPESFSFRYAQYQERGATGGALLTIFYLLITTFFILIRNFISKKNIAYYDVYLNITIFNTLIYIIVFITGLDVNLMRLSQYFALGFVFIWPIIFKETNFKLKPLLTLFFIIGHLGFYYIYLSKMSKLTPYILNTQIFNNY